MGEYMRKSFIISFSFISLAFITSCTVSADITNVPIEQSVATNSQPEQSVTDNYQQMNSNRMTVIQDQNDSQSQGTDLFVYDCTHGYISNNPGYGPYTQQGGCQDGTAKMELVDHEGTLEDAYHECERRGMRLPTYHELSAAGNFAQELNLLEGNYWAADVKNGIKYNQNCFMPTGNCGEHFPGDIQYFRCVVK